MTDPTDWDVIRSVLDEKIPVYTTENPTVNQEFERERAKTINWIIARMMAGPKSGGTRLLAPDFVQTYSSGLWKAVRCALLTKNPECYLCGEKAEEVHHIWPRALQGSEYDPRNLVCMCCECHDYLHRRLDESFQIAIKNSLRIEPAEGWS